MSSARNLVSFLSVEGKKRINAERCRSQRKAQPPHPREVQGEQKAAVTDRPRCDALYRYTH
ncbi:MAG TPA: hypothetical protein VK514_11565 [Candidatus Acidoferrum sp.]|nr:hypothetical protein [Candidatus Acidoferrum sp.]